MAKAQPAGRLARWALRMQEFQFKIVYQPGKTNQRADCLSRIPIRAVSHWEPKWTDWHEAQKGDEMCKKILQKMQDPVPPGSEENNKYVLLSNGLIATKDGRILVPLGKRKEILELNHNHKLAGHGGIARTLARLRDRFTWSNMTSDVITHVQNCL